MNKTTEEEFLDNCLLLIETKLAWGSSENWTNYDFDNLSEAIHQKTGIRLSITTLKRLWGKLKYDNSPTLTTLNTLARFAGFEDWRTFKQNEAEHPENADIEVSNIKKPDNIVKKNERNFYWLIMGSTLIIVAYFLVSTTRKPENKINPADFSFKANKIVTDGVPNSVVFYYDATQSKSDSVYIVQMWDISRKTLVPKNGHEHSAIYYYPGFFNTKLIVDGQIVKTHDLQITSNGWLGLVEGDEKPFYFNKNDYLKSDRVEIDEALLQRNNFTLKPEPPKIRFFNQRDMGNLMNDNFIFETTLKNEYKGGTNACQNVQVLVQCKNDIIIIPLSAKECIGALQLYFCGKGVSSKEADLSGFGVDLTQWTKLRVEAVQKSVKILVNDKEIYAFTFPNEPTGIVGVQYRFNGVGAVKDTWFKNDSLYFKLDYK